MEGFLMLEFVDMEVDPAAAFEEKCGRIEFARREIDKNVVVISLADRFQNGLNGLPDETRVFGNGF